MRSSHLSFIFMHPVHEIMLGKTGYPNLGIFNKSCPQKKSRRYVLFFLKKAKTIRIHMIGS